MSPREIASAYPIAPLSAAPIRSVRNRLERRDPRRFGQARTWVERGSPVLDGQPSGDLSLFAHSFVGFFVFFSLLIA